MADQPTQRQQWRAGVLARREDRVRGLAQQARQAADAVATCQRWLAAGGLARRYLADAEHRGDDADVVAHRGELRVLADDADAAVAACEPEVAARARAGQGIRVAVVGKGGTGKSVIAGTLARLLARRGRSVLACDLDGNPGLAYSLGVSQGHGVLSDAAIAEQPGAPYGWALHPDLDPAETVRSHSVAASDGVWLLSCGKSGDVDNAAPKRTLSALLEVVGGFAEPGWDVVGDLEAGVTTPFERYHGFADRVLIAVTPTWASVLTARRLWALVEGAQVDVVANQWRDEQVPEGLPPLVRLGRDECVAEAEHRGVAPLDACPHAPPMAELDALADHMIRQEVVAV